MKEISSLLKVAQMNLDLRSVRLPGIKLIYFYVQKVSFVKVFYYQLWTIVKHELL